jgi:hypothetical protein
MVKRSANPSAMESLIGVTHNAFTQIGGFDENIPFAEGVYLLKKALRLGLRFEVFKDPVYTYSFRRFRTQGALRMAQNASLTVLTQFLNLSLPLEFQQKLYPMHGGQFFDQTSPPKTSLEFMLKKFFKVLKIS